MSDNLLMVSSASLAAAAQQLRDTDVPSAILSKCGARATIAQLETAAGLLRDGPKSQITKATGVRSGSVNFDPQEIPGFFHRERQEPDVLVMDVGILTGQTYRIAADGQILEKTPSQD